MPTLSTLHITLRVTLVVFPRGVIQRPLLADARSRSDMISRPMSSPASFSLRGLGEEVLKCAYMVLGRVSSPSDGVTFLCFLVN